MYVCVYICVCVCVCVRVRVCVCVCIHVYVDTRVVYSRDFRYAAREPQADQSRHWCGRVVDINYFWSIVDIICLYICDTRRPATASYNSYAFAVRVNYDVIIMVLHSNAGSP
jgi:hypothetical protein